MACAGDVPTLEALAATALLRADFPALRVRFVNVVDLMRLQPAGDHPHGLDDAAFDALFTTDKPVIFAYHGYPAIVHRYTYNRANHDNVHVHGFIEEGTTTTPFDMVVRNRLDRYHLALAAIERLPTLGADGAAASERYRAKLAEHERHIVLRGEDLPEVRDWTWPF